ncbi:MAG: GNAT family N-acetyltransferase [Sarcina sp.]
MIYQVSKNLRESLKVFFEGSEDTIILSCLQGHMGEAWVDNLINPTMVELIVGDFVFFAGEPKGEAGEELLINIPINSIVFTESSKWKEKIKAFYKGDCKIEKRYSFYKNKEDLDINFIKDFYKEIPQGYKLKKLDKELLENYDVNKLSNDFTAQFNSMEDYLKRGRGYYLLKDGEVISGASSYSIYNDGIEIEIDTAREYRRKGLATIVASALIVDCLENGLYPSWDAANLKSLALAEKLGYKLNKEYEICSISYSL